MTSLYGPRHLADGWGDSRGELWIPSYEGLYRWFRSKLPTAIVQAEGERSPVRCGCKTNGRRGRPV